MTTIETDKNVVEDDISPIDTQFNAVLGTLSQFKTQITTISMQLRTLEKLLSVKLSSIKRKL